MEGQQNPRNLLDMMVLGVDKAWDADKQAQLDALKGHEDVWATSRRDMANMPAVMVPRRVIRAPRLGMHP